MAPQDVVKLCYQAARGAEHLLADTKRAEAMLEAELASVTPEEGALYEQISDDVCRVNLAAWRATGMPPPWLFRMFLASCRVREGGEDLLAEYLDRAGAVLAEGAPFPLADWEAYLAEYRKAGMPAVRHTEGYRAAERPAYRIVSARICRALPILLAVAAHKEDAPCVIAIDGRCASGKSTLAEGLATVLDGDLIHMDDFFVPPALRSEERFRTPGENIHHERFCEEVLPHVKRNAPFAYRIFDCGRMDYHGMREIGARPFRIVEGSYSTHSHFGRYADITVFSDVAGDVQRERILARDGEAMLRNFVTRWIPMEEAYFAHYQIRDRVTVTV